MSKLFPNSNPSRVMAFTLGTLLFSCGGASVPTRADFPELDGASVVQETPSCAQTSCGVTLTYLPDPDNDSCALAISIIEMAVDDLGATDISTETSEEVCTGEVTGWSAAVGDYIWIVRLSESDTVDLSIELIGDWPLVD